ncbi:unnamed protein product [Peniophora sp. CBMAI 1063]|nr:unnamed protein product [Peniophora sp. CBMAI 1063]
MQYHPYNHTTHHARPPAAHYQAEFRPPVPHPYSQNQSREPHPGHTYNHDGYPLHFRPGVGPNSVRWPAQNPAGGAWRGGQYLPGPSIAFPGTQDPAEVHYSTQSSHSYSSTLHDTHRSTFHQQSNTDIHSQYGAYPNPSLPGPHQHHWQPPQQTHFYPNPQQTQSPYIPPPPVHHQAAPQPWEYNQNATPQQNPSPEQHTPPTTPPRVTVESSRAPPDSPPNRTVPSPAVSGYDYPSIPDEYEYLRDRLARGKLVEDDGFRGCSQELGGWGVPVTRLRLQIHNGYLQAQVEENKREYRRVIREWEMRKMDEAQAQEELIGDVRQICSAETETHDGVGPSVTGSYTGSGMSITSSSSSSDDAARSGTPQTPAFAEYGGTVPFQDSIWRLSDEPGSGYGYGDCGMDSESERQWFEMRSGRADRTLVGDDVADLYAMSPLSNNLTYGVDLGSFS